MLIFVPAEDPSPNCARPSPVRIMTRNLNTYSAKFKLVLKILFTFSLIRWRHLIWATRFHEISWYFEFQKEITVCYNWYNSQKTTHTSPSRASYEVPIERIWDLETIGRVITSLHYIVLPTKVDNIPSSFLWLEWFLISFREPDDVRPTRSRETLWVFKSSTYYATMCMEHCSCFLSRCQQLT